MVATQQQEDGSIGRHVLVSNTAVNMISSLHPSNRSKVNAALATIKSSVLNPANVRKIVGVDNAFVARAGNLRVFFKEEGDAVLITSITAKG